MDRWNREMEVSERDLISIEPTMLHAVASNTRLPQVSAVIVSLRNNIHKIKNISITLR